MSLLSENVATVIQAGHTVAHTLRTLSTLPGQVNVSVGDFAVPLGDTVEPGTYEFALDLPIPAGAFVSQVVFDITEAFITTGDIGIGLNTDSDLSNGVQPAPTWATLYSLGLQMLANTLSTHLNLVCDDPLTAGAVSVKVLWV